MPDPMHPDFTAQNPIVAAAERIRARRKLEGAIESAESGMQRAIADDAEASLGSFALGLAVGAKRLNAILGRSAGVTVIVLQRPLRVRLRMQDRRVAMDLDDPHQLVRVTGLDLDGEYQFDPAPGVPALINLSKISTEEGYGRRLTASSLLRQIAADAELPPPEL